MNYQNINQEFNNLNFQKKNVFGIFGLYLFSLGTTFLGYSSYLFLEAFGLVKRSVTTWNAQGLFWFLVIFCVSLFIMFIPIEFLNVFRIYNQAFKDLIINIIAVIFTSVISLVFFQFFLNPTNLVISNLIDIGKAVSFSGFIAIPLILFLHHNFRRTINFSDNLSYSLILFAWIISSQLFL